jgi:hypothetical protein
LNYSPFTFIVNQAATLISFPGTGGTLWFNLATGNYRVNDNTAQTSPAIITSRIGSGSPANSIFTVSDGVSMFIIYRVGQSQGVQGSVDFTTGTITTTEVTFSAAQAYGTEEDAIGNQLFAIDGDVSYYTNLTYRYSLLSVSNRVGWRDRTSLTSPGYDSINVGSVDTQTGMDILSTIDAVDNYAWFCDWGHDNGGLFNVGNDSILSMVKTNIQKIPTTYAD